MTLMKCRSLLSLKIHHLFGADHNGVFSLRQRVNTQRPVGYFGGKLFLHDDFALFVEHLYGEALDRDFVGHKPDAFLADKYFDIGVVAPSGRVGGGSGLANAEEQTKKSSQ